MELIVSAELKTRLKPEEIKKAEAAISKLLKEEAVYEVSCYLEEVEGGYNIVVVNKAEQGDVSGLIDPSFVVYYVAPFTRGTNWKSETLKIWLVDSLEGYGILTKDCRIAENAASTSVPIYWFYYMKVLNPSEFRKLIKPKFFKLPPHPEAVARKKASEESLFRERLKYEVRARAVWFISGGIFVLLITLGLGFCVGLFVPRFFKAKKQKLPEEGEGVGPETP